MYVANLTKQIVEFAFRQPEHPGVRRQTIPMGGQIRISGPNNSPLTTQEIDSIVKQHAKYGMVALGDIDRRKPFIGLCYSPDKQIKVDVIARGVAHNTDVLVERGKLIRKQAAVAINNGIEHDLAERPQMQSNLRQLDLTVQQEDAPEDGSKQLSEGITVSRTGQEGEGGGRRRRQRDAR